MTLSPCSSCSSSVTDKTDDIKPEEKDWDQERRELDKRIVITPRKPLPEALAPEFKAEIQENRERLRRCITGNKRKKFLDMKAKYNASVEEEKTDRQ